MNIFLNHLSVNCSCCKNDKALPTRNNCVCTHSVSKHKNHTIGNNGRVENKNSKKINTKWIVLNV